MANKLIQITSGSDNMFPKELSVRGTITYESGISSIPYESYVTRRGEMVFLHLALQGLPSGTSNMTVATLSDIKLPGSVIRGFCGSGTEAYLAYHPCYFAIGTNGGVTITKTVSADTKVNINACWRAS